MPKNGRIPSYRLHKSSGRAVVTLNGRDIYLGPYGSAWSREKYDRLIRVWLEAGRELAGGALEQPPALTVAELILKYWTHAKEYYRRNGRALPELYSIRTTLRPVRRLYGNQPASAFGPLALKRPA